MVGDKFTTAQAMYLAETRRLRSGESDFGVWWLGGNLGRTTHRVTAIKDTGEIYVERLVQGLPDEPYGECEILADGLTLGSYDDAEKVLEGWAEECGEKDSMQWIRERCAEFDPTCVRCHDAKSKHLLRSVVLAPGGPSEARLLCSNVPGIFLSTTAAMNEPKFPLGMTVITAPALMILDDDGTDARQMLDRHVRGDWGDLGDEDKAENDRAVKTGRDRIVSRYATKVGDFYVITEADRSSTTVMRVEDY